MCGGDGAVVFAFQAWMKRGVYASIVWMWYVRSSFYCLFESQCMHVIHKYSVSVWWRTIAKLYIGKGSLGLKYCVSSIMGFMQQVQVYTCSI